MKKIILTLAIAISTLGAFASEVKVSSFVLNSFKSDFSTAKQIEWTANTNYYKATFVMNDQHMFAFYAIDGELLGVTRYIRSIDLPMTLQSRLKKTYGDYWISDLFEVSNANGTDYYITVEDANSKVVLESKRGSDWSVYQKSTKA
jgi:hypothetical protein